MRILLWHVHGSWTTSFVQGPHDYVVPVDAERGPDGRGRACTWDWPASVTEVPLDDLADADFDVVLLQRPHEPALAERLLRRRPGRDIPAVYVEHNTPGAGAVTSRHPLAGQAEIPVVHVTHFNQLMWDSGRAPTVVIEHGIVDPGPRYTGREARAAVVINEPVRRGRAVGTDLLVDLVRHVPVDVFGMQVDLLHQLITCSDGSMRTFADEPQDRLHDQLACRRVYVHTHRWTSLGFSLLEAMHLGMPVVVLAATEAAAIPSDVGCVSTRPDELYAAAVRLLHDPSRAGSAGSAAREFALRRYGLGRFLDEWDTLLHDVPTRTADLKGVR
ncbi:MAG: glycosyltransferase [Nocardioidaceae bacterium]